MTVELSRRTFIAGAALAWVAPTIVSITPADAAVRHSAPPRPSAPPVMGAPLASTLPGQLPFTGDDEQRGAELGIVTVAAGAGLLALAHRGRELTS